MTSMRIEPWMKRPVATVKPRDTVLDARRTMEKQRINQLPVLLDGTVVGIVTDRDLRDAFPSVFDEPTGKARTVQPGTVAVEDVMAQKVLSLAPEDLLVDAARLMRRERIGAIPIVSDGRLVGILTRSDLLDAFVELVRDVTTAG